MQFGTTPYPLECPDALWNPLTRAQGDENRNEQIVRAIAAYVDDADVNLSDDERDAVDWYLDHS